MDRRTEFQLNRIGNQIPKTLLKSSIIIEKDEQKAIAEEMLGNSRLSPKSRAQLKKSLERGDFDTVSRRINPEANAKMDRFVEKRVQHEIRAGRLKPASKNDPFIRKMKKALRVRK